MGTTAEKINRLTQTKSDLKTVINYTGANITNQTTFKEYPKLLNKAYIDILNNGTDDLYDALPKTTARGSNLTLNTEEGKMSTTLKGNVTQDNVPTPTNPQNINVVTGEQNIQIVGKNLFDKDNSNIINAYTDSTLVTSGTSSTFYIKCAPNTTYTVSRQLVGKRFQVAECSTLPTIGVALSNLTPSDFTNELSSITITTSATAKYLCVFYSNVYGGLDNNNGYTEEEIRSSIQIEKGSQATEYEPYQSQNYPINLGKNLFDVSNLSSQTNVGVTSTFDNSKITFNGTSTAGVVVTKSDLGYKLKPGTYTFHFEDISGNYQNPNSKDLAIFLTNSSSDTAFGNVNLRRTRPYISFTITEDTEIYLYMYINGEITFNNWTIGFQIEKGSTATEYQPYFEPIELCKIGDYQDSIYYNSNWYYSNLFTKIESYNGETITTPYISTTGGLDTGATIYYYNSSNSPIQITDTTLIQLLNNLKNAKSYEDITNIIVSNVNNENLLLDIEVSALAKIDLEV